VYIVVVLTFLMIIFENFRLFKNDKVCKVDYQSYFLIVTNLFFEATTKMDGCQLHKLFMRERKTTTYMSMRTRCGEVWLLLPDLLWRSFVDIRSLM